jgi:hypothetical protein
MLFYESFWVQIATHAQARLSTVTSLQASYSTYMAVIENFKIHMFYRIGHSLTTKRQESNKQCTSAPLTANISDSYCQYFNNLLQIHTNVARIVYYAYAQLMYSVRTCHLLYKDAENKILYIFTYNVVKLRYVKLFLASMNWIFQWAYYIFSMNDWPDDSLTVLGWDMFSVRVALLH